MHILHYLCVYYTFSKFYCFSIREKSRRLLQNHRWVRDFSRRVHINICTLRDFSRRVRQNILTLRDFLHTLHENLFSVPDIINYNFGYYQCNSIGEDSKV